MSIPTNNNLTIDNPATLFDITQEDTSYSIPTQTWKKDANFDLGRVFSVKGWLVLQKIYSSQNQNYHLLLFSNPLSGQEFQLPPLPLFQGNVDVSCVSVNLTFSSSPPDSSEFIVVVCTTLSRHSIKQQQLAFCNVSEKSWTLIPKEHHEPSWDEFVICDWKLYAMNSSTSLAVFNLKDSNFITSKRLEPKSIPESLRTTFGYYKCRLARDGDEMLFVVHCMHPTRGFRTSAFRVFKLDVCGTRWIEVDDLGDRVLLIDCNGAQVISAKEMNLDGGNLVFFCFDSGIGGLKSDIGVFSLKESFRCLHLCRSLDVSGRCLWYTPSLW